MSDQSHDQPQYETIDVPPDPEILLGWAKRILEIVPLGDSPSAAAWDHQRVLWERSYEMYKHLPQPEYPPVQKIEWLSTASAHDIDVPTPPEATLTLLSDAGPILGMPTGTRGEQGAIAKEILAQWSAKMDEPLVLPWPVDVRDLRG